MAVRLLQGQTVDGVLYPRFDVLVGLGAKAEADLIAGGGAAPINVAVLPAAQAAALAAIAAGTPNIAFGICGQSVELGQVLGSDEAAYPQAFASLRQPGFCAPMAGHISTKAGLRAGAPWFIVHDALKDWGYNPRWYNGAIGNASMVTAFAGQVKTRANSTSYGMLRAPLGDGADMGYQGDFIVMGGKLWRCTTGNYFFAMREATSFPAQASGFVSPLDYLSSIGTLASAAADPGGWSSGTLGSTITDGGIVWTCVDATNSLGYSAGMVFSETMLGLGFDPYGILRRITTRMELIQDVAAKHIILCNGQADTGQNTATYATAMTNVARFFLRRGYYVWFGLSCYSPLVLASGYDNLTAGVATALANCQADTAWGARAIAGVNNYQLMGTTGPMALGGAWLQADNTHLNGAGNVAYANNWADRLRAVLPKLSY